jgi:hypothetical protein
VESKFSIRFGNMKGIGSKSPTVNNVSSTGVQVGTMGILRLIVIQHAFSSLDCLIAVQNVPLMKENMLKQVF